MDLVDWQTPARPPPHEICRAFSEMVAKASGHQRMRDRTMSPLDKELKTFMHEYSAKGGNLSG